MEGSERRMEAISLPGGVAESVYPILAQNGRENRRHCFVQIHVPLESIDSDALEDLRMENRAVLRLSEQQKR